MADPLGFQGIRLWSTNERATSTGVNAIGTIAEASLYSFLLGRMLCWDADNSQPFEGFVGDAFEVSINSGLTLDVAAGVAMKFFSAAANAFTPNYIPIVLPAATTTTLDAHDPSNPRIDVISCTATTADDTSATVSVIDPATGVVSASSLSTRRKRSYTLTVTKGTPGATPSAPSTPTNHLKIAEVLVPASSGAVTIYDHRQPLRLGPEMQPHPLLGYASDHVPGTGTELQVSATSGMVLAVARGEAYIDGKIVTYPRSTVTVSAADATLDRVDTVYADVDGTKGVSAGTPGSTTPGAIASDQVALAYIDVGATVTSIGGGDITDARTRNPIGTGQLIDEAVTAAKIADNAVTNAKINTGAVDSDEIATGAVITAKIDDLAVTTAKIAAAAVTTAKIDDLGVTTGKIADLAVTSGKIANGAVDTTQLADEAVTYQKIAEASRVLYLNVTVGPEASDKIRVSVQVENPDGSDFAEAIEIIATLYTPPSGVSSVSSITTVTGSDVLGDRTDLATVVLYVHETDASGLLEIDYESPDVGDLFVQYQIAGRPGVTSYANMTFA